MTFFEDAASTLNLLGSYPIKWRKPQLGAIGALLQSFSLDDGEPPLVSIPTGSGKTAIAMIAPHLILPRPQRVLIIEPSVELRRQVAEEAETQSVLQQIGCLQMGIEGPSVLEIRARVGDWHDVEEADFVIAHPNSISPSHYQALPPPSDLFDLIIVDEAHHLPAPTWQNILAHFQGARSVLLTATPFRRDRKRIPGRIVYHYPVSKALKEGIYNPVIPELIPVTAGESRPSVDQRIAEIAAELLASNDHSTSSILIRGASVERAEELAALYTTLGINAEVLHSRFGNKRKARIIQGLRLGETRAVVVVGMLGEGFDLPSLRIAAYHDKHRSTLSSIQLIGRLARTHTDFPQQSILIAAQDADVYPELRDAVRKLYEEDSDWSKVLPGLIDEEVARSEADQEYVDQFSDSQGVVVPALLTPPNRGTFYEFPKEWVPQFQGRLLEEMHLGKRLGGATVIFLGVNPEGNTLVIVTRNIEQPRWSKDTNLQDIEYGLTVISYRVAPQVNMCSLLVENSDSPKVLARIRDLLGIYEYTRRIDPELVSRYLDGLERSSISSIGLRAERSYRNLLGQNVGKLLRTSDVSRAGLGHVMLQTSGEQGRSITVGGATAKGKIWSTQYSSLRAYDEWVDDVTNRIWFARVGSSGPVLPEVSRGARLTKWPTTPIISVDFSPELYSQGWSFHVTSTTMNLEDVSLGLPTTDWKAPAPDGAVTIHAYLSGDDERPFWTGTLHIDGSVHTLEGPDVEVRRGYGVDIYMEEFLSHHPPIIHFLDGRRAQGDILYEDRAFRGPVSPSSITDVGWEGVDIKAETRATALHRGTGLSIHEAVENLILDTPRRGRRWVMCNDGKGELADYVVLEDLGRGRVALEFWHAKAAGGEPGIRIKDLQVVTAQALRSRRFLPSKQLWEKIRRRLNGDEFPALTLVNGSQPKAYLLARLGFDNNRWTNGWRHSWQALQSTPEARIVIVQPGLSKAALMEQISIGNSPSNSGIDIASLLNVFEDFALAEGWTARVISSA